MRTIISESVGGPRQPTVASQTKKVERLAAKLVGLKKLLEQEKAKLDVVKKKAKEKAKLDPKAKSRKKPVSATRSKAKSTVKRPK